VTYTSAEATGSMKFTPVVDAVGSTSITVTVEDGGLDGNLATTADNGTVSQTFDVTVTAVNDMPTLDPLADLTIAEDAAEQTFALSGITAGDDESQPLKVTALSDNTGLVPNPSVTYTSAETTGSIAFTPVTDASGSATITVTVEDGGMDGNLATTADNGTFARVFELTVTAVNDAPIASDATFQPSENEDFIKDRASGLATLVDDVDGDSLIFSVAVLPSHGTLVLNQDGSYKFTPSTNFNRTDSFTFRADDGTTTSNTGTVTLEVDTVFPWHNFEVPEDVNGDGHTVPGDVLRLINALNSGGGGVLSTSRSEGVVTPYLDVNHDGEFSSADAVVVVNAVNAGSSGSGEGESIASSEVRSAAFAVYPLISPIAPTVSNRIESAAVTVPAEIELPASQPFWQCVDEAFASNASETDRDDQLADETGDDGDSDQWWRHNADSALDVVLAGN